MHYSASTAEVVTEDSCVLLVTASFSCQTPAACPAGRRAAYSHRRVCRFLKPPSFEEAIGGFREVSFNEASGLKTLLFTGTFQQPKNGVETPEEGAATTGALTQTVTHRGELWEKGRLSIQEK